MLDPEFGNTIEDFQDEAAKQFALLATEYGMERQPAGDGMAEEVHVGEEVNEPGSPAHGSDAGETVRQPETGVG